MGYPPQTLADSNPSIAFSSVGEMAAFRPPNFRIFSIVGESGSGYQWTPGDTSTANGVDIVAQSNVGGVAGRWLRKWIGGSTGTSGSMMFFETLADAQAAPGPSARTIAWIAETDAPYDFVPADATPVDTGLWTVIDNTGGTNGRWLLRSDRISIAPRGGGNDDMPRLMSAMNACQSKCRIELRAGAWVSATQCDVPGNTWLMCEPGVAITTSVGAGVCVFKAVATTTTTGALTANVALGSYTFLDNTSFAVGDDVRLGGTGSTNIHVGSRYTIKAKAGGAPFTYTVERPIMFPFVIGDPSRLVSAAGRNIVMEGNGATITGPCDYAFQFQVTDGYVRGWKYVATSNVGSAAFSNELSAVNTWFDDCVADLTANNSMIAFFLECGENSGYRRCHSWGGLRGASSYDGVNSLFEDCVCVGWSSLGIMVTCHPTQTSPGSKNVIVRGGSYSGGLNIGVSVQYATDTKIIEVASDYNIQGFNVGTSGGVAVRTRVIGCSVVGTTAGQYTYVTTATGQDTKFDRCTGVGSGAGRLIGSIDSVEFDECEETGCTVSTNYPMVVAISNSANARVTCYGGTISIAAGAGAQPLVQKSTGACILSFDRTRFTMTANGQTAITDATGGCVTLRDVLMTQSAASSGYVSTAAGCTLRRYGRCDTDTIGTPVTIFAGSFTNRGTVTLNGTPAAVAVAFNDLKTGETPKLTVNAKNGAGGVGAFPIIALTPGTGFTALGLVNDTSIWTYEI